MKKFTVLIICLLTTTIGFAQGGTMPDWANKKGTIGIGANPSLGVTSGNDFTSTTFGLNLPIRIFVADNIEIDPSIGIIFNGTRGDDYSTNDNAITFGVDIGYVFAFWQRSTLSAVFGVTAVDGSWNQELGPFQSEGDFAEIIYGLGLRGEWFPTQFTSLPISVGLSLDILSFESNGNTLSDQGKVTVNALGATDLLGSAGFTFWF